MPNFNQGNFMETTIVSVLDQGYPNMKNIVFDGKSVNNFVFFDPDFNSKLASLLENYWLQQPIINPINHETTKNNFTKEVVTLV